MVAHCGRDGLLVVVAAAAYAAAGGWAHTLTCSISRRGRDQVVTAASYSAAVPKGPNLRNGSSGWAAVGATESAQPCRPRQLVCTQRCSRRGSLLGREEAAADGEVDDQVKSLVPGLARGFVRRGRRCSNTGRRGEQCEAEKDALG